MRRPTTLAMAMAATLVAAIACPGTAAGAASIVYPTKDGTLRDGQNGPFDGVADAWDYSFNQSSFEGSITLSTASELEDRLFWEYNLSAISLTPPVSATLTFTIRGAAIFPFPNTVVHVYSYPSDLVESINDFSAGPAHFEASVTIVPFQAPTEYSIEVGPVVSQALSAGTDKVAFRFQVNPGTPEASNQAFIDALDSDPATKPYLTIDVYTPVPGDGNEDGVVDLEDHALFTACMGGPGVTAATGCELFLFDPDTDVDLADFKDFQALIPGQS